MTARDHAESAIRTRLRALNRALNADPVDRPRVSTLAVRLGDACESLPGDHTGLDRAVYDYANRAALWAVFGVPNDTDEMLAAAKAVELHRRALMLDGERVPY